MSLSRPHPLSVNVIVVCCCGHVHFSLKDKNKSKGSLPAPRSSLRCWGCVQSTKTWTWRVYSAPKTFPTVFFSLFYKHKLFHGESQRQFDQMPKFRALLLQHKAQSGLIELSEWSWSSREMFANILVGVLWFRLQADCTRAPLQNIMNTEISEQFMAAQTAWKSSDKEAINIVCVIWGTQWKRRDSWEHARVQMKARPQSQLWKEHNFWELPWKLVWDQAHSKS